MAPDAATNIEHDHRCVEEILRRGESHETWIAEHAGRGIRSWQAAAEAGDPRGQVLYGLCLSFGSGGADGQSTR